MIEHNRYFVNAQINNFNLPVKTASKYSYKEQCTVASISVSASIDRQYESLFNDDIIKIINNCGLYTSVNHLIGSLLKYINTLNAKEASINIVYPYFAEKVTGIPGERNLVEYICRETLNKVSLINYQKNFTVEIPVLLDYPRGNSAAPVVYLIVEAEGFVQLFVEDITDIVKQHINLSRGGRLAAKDAHLLLQNRFAESIQDELISKYHVDKCSVKIKGAQQLISKSTKHKNIPLKEAVPEQQWVA